jgi:hypothetical protein
MSVLNVMNFILPKNGIYIPKGHAVIVRREEGITVSKLIGIHILGERQLSSVLPVISLFSGLIF